MACGSPDLSARPEPPARPALSRAHRALPISPSRPGRAFRHQPKRQPPTPDPRSLPRSPHPPRTGPELLAVDRPDTGRRPGPLGGRGECDSELTTAGQSARAAPLTTVAGSSPRGLTTSGWNSPRLGGTHHATHHAVVSGLGYRLRRPGPSPCSAGFWPWPHPAGPSGPLPGVHRRVQRGVRRRVRRGLHRGVHRGVRSSWAASLVSPGQALVLVWCVVGLPLLRPWLWWWGSGRWGRWRSSEASGALRWPWGDRVGRWPPRPEGRLWRAAG